MMLMHQSYHKTQRGDLYFIKYPVINNGWDIQIEQFHFIFLLVFSISVLVKQRFSLPTPRIWVPMF